MMAMANDHADEALLAVLCDRWPGVKEGPTGNACADPLGRGQHWLNAGPCERIAGRPNACCHDSAAADDEARQLLFATSPQLRGRPTLRRIWVSGWRRPENRLGWFAMSGAAEFGGTAQAKRIAADRMPAFAMFRCDGAGCQQRSCVPLSTAHGGEQLGHGTITLGEGFQSGSPVCRDWQQRRRRRRGNGGTIWRRAQGDGRRWSFSLQPPESRRGCCIQT